MWGSAISLAFKYGKNPIVIISIIAIIIIGFLYVRIQYLETKINIIESKLVKTEANLDRMENNFNICKTNEDTLLISIEKQKESIGNMEKTTDALAQQLKTEQENAAKWEERYKNRPVITEIKEVKVVEYIDKGLVIDEESSKKYIDYFNSIMD